MCYKIPRILNYKFLTFTSCELWYHFLSIAEWLIKKEQVGKDQEKAQSEKDSHSKNRDGKKLTIR